MGISFENLTHSYAGIKKGEVVEAISNLSLKIDGQNEFVAICGKTGSGKSTLVSHINGLLLPTSGSVKVFEYTITPNKRKNPKMKPIRKKVGFVFQFPEYQLFEETVLKDVMFAPKNFGLKEEVAKEKAIEACRLVGISDEIMAKSPFNLSGGQMRKVAIAGILAYEPDILVLDEPTRGLDPKGQKEIMELFYEIYKKLNKTIILISHDMDIVYEYATRVIVLKDGKVAYDGDKLTLFAKKDLNEFHLEKPQVIKLIDYLNEKIGLNIGYENYNEESLLDSLKEVIGHE